jgi:hypothetical protein
VRLHPLQTGGEPEHVHHTPDAAGALSSGGTYGRTNDDVDTCTTCMHTHARARTHTQAAAAAAAAAASAHRG